MRTHLVLCNEDRTVVSYSTFVWFLCMHVGVYSKASPAGATFSFLNSLLNLVFSLLYRENSFFLCKAVDSTT